MRVVFFSKGDFDVVSSRYRCFYFAQALADNGIDTEICSPPPTRFGPWHPLSRLRELVRLAQQLLRIRKGEIAYIQRAIQSNDFVALVVIWKLCLRRRMVFDFCDPIFMHSPRKTKLLVRLADAVVVSCEDLASWARQHSPSVHIVPNCPQPDTPIRDHRDTLKREGCVIGWAGSAVDHKDNLRLVFAVLSKVSGPFIFRLIGARGADDVIAELRNLNFASEVVGWVEAEDAPKALADLDIAVLPVQDTVWNRKLLTKMIDYLAAGLPIVASPVGENRFAIVDGENGFLARSENEWVERLERLLHDETLRQNMGRRARETVSERYSLAENGKRLASILRDMAPAAPTGTA